MSDLETSRAGVVLLVDDDPADVLRFREALDRARLPLALAVVGDGEAALDYLRRRPPFARVPPADLVLLDLCLPRRSGAAVLADLKADPRLRPVPVIVFAGDAAGEDGGDELACCYRRHANCVVRKPADVGGLVRLLETVDAFWFRTAALPRGARRGL